MPTSLAMVTRDPFCMEWKRTDKVIGEALRRGFEIVIALDYRSCEACKVRISSAADVLVGFRPKNDSCDTMLNHVVQAARNDTVLLVSDDEEPSPALWRFAARPTLPGMSYVVRMLTPLPDHRIYKLGSEEQMRVLSRKNWKWAGGIDGYDDHGGQAGAVPLVLWHFATYAPRAFREEKLMNYRNKNDLASASQWAEFGLRHFWEDRPEEVRPMTPEEKAEFPA